MPRRFPFVRILLIVFTGLLFRFAYTSYQSSTPSRHSRPDAAMSPSKPLRLAVLEADTPQPKTLERDGNYTALYTHMLRAGCEVSTPPRKLEEELVISGFHVVEKPDNYPSLDDVDAILISGSKHNSFANDPWIVKLVEFTKAALATNRVRVIGVCFGHQILGRALGADVGRNSKGWELAVRDVELTPEGKKVFGLEKMRIQQMHTDIVHDFPAGAIALGSNDNCAVQAMYSPGKYIAVQGHPEFTEIIVNEILENRHISGLFPDDLFNDAMSVVAKEHDGAKIAAAFLDFLHN